MTESLKPTDSRLGNLISPLVDCLTMAAYFFFLPWLARSYLSPSLVNGVIIGFSFIMLLVAMHALKQLAFIKKQHESQGLGSAITPQKVASRKAKKSEDGCGSNLFVRMGLSFIYCGFLALVFLTTATRYDLDSSAGENTGALLMFVGAMIVLIVLALPSSNKVTPDSTHATWLHALSVTGVALNTFVLMAFWESMKLADPGGAPEQFQGIWKLIIFLLLLLVFAGFMGLPRIYLHLVRGDRWGMLTYIASLGYYVWDLFEF